MGTGSSIIARIGTIASTHCMDTVHEENRGKSQVETYDMRDAYTFTLD